MKERVSAHKSDDGVRLLRVLDQRVQGLAELLGRQEEGLLVAAEPSTLRTLKNAGVCQLDLHGLHFGDRAHYSNSFGAMMFSIRALSRGQAAFK
jgi:hypothetical protein